MAKHERTLAAVFAEPTRANIRWSDIEALFTHLGATLEEGEGSRVYFLLNGVGSTFHRPHPEKEAHKYTVRSVRKFLVLAGCRP